MENGKASEILRRQIDATAKLKGKAAWMPDFKKWYRDSEIAIEKIFGSSTRHLSDFHEISFSPGSWYTGMPDDADFTSCRNGLASAGQILQSMIDEIAEYGTDPSVKEAGNNSAVVQRICERFHLIARRLRERREGRPTLEVEDEYDVQDLTHALLHLHFDDIRTEEWTPSYAGASSRMDFLLKQEQIVVELKKTRKGLATKEVGEQLIIDIQKYRVHPDCKTLICFVYDPDGRIANPRGLESDLNNDGDEFKVQVIVAPKGA